MATDQANPNAATISALRSAAKIAHGTNNTLKSEGEVDPYELAYTLFAIGRALDAVADQYEER